MSVALSAALRLSYAAQCLTVADGKENFTDRREAEGGSGFMELKLNQRVELKKSHPCGSKVWTILRVGMDIKLRCEGCGHELMLPRSKAEKAIKKILSEEERT